MAIQRNVPEKWAQSRLWFTEQVMIHVIGHNWVTRLKTSLATYVSSKINWYMEWTVDRTQLCACYYAMVWIINLVFIFACIPYLMSDYACVIHMTAKNWLRFHVLPMLHVQILASLALSFVFFNTCKHK